LGKEVYARPIPLKTGWGLRRLLIPVTSAVRVINGKREKKGAIK